MAYDIVIRGGTVVDGSGMPSYRADVGVAGGKIAAIGRIRELGREEIDAEGHAVTPGFVDGHTHMDAQIFWDQLGTCSCYHGVTSVVMGNCGFTLAPVRRGEEALVVRNLERAEDISPAALAAGIQWTWSSFREYLDTIDRLPKGINYAANIGHSALRTWAMGERAFDGPATEDDLRLMERELSDALDAGAIGFSSSRTDQHATSDDRPVASRLAEWSELSRLVGTMGRSGRGVFELASEPAATSADPAIRGEFFARLRALARETGVPVAVPFVPGAHLDALTRMIDDSAAEGGNIFGLSHSRGISMLLTFHTKLPFDTLPEWRDLRAKPLDEQRVLLGDSALRRRLVDAANSGQYAQAIGAEVRKPDYELLYLLDRPSPPYRSVAELARERRMDPTEVLINLAVESNFEQFFLQPLRYWDEAQIERTMKYPRAVMTFSDAGAHVSQIFDFSIHTHLLSHWVRERQAFTFEEAIRMITFAPARAWGLADRGLLREGLVADINVIDPGTIGCEMPRISADLPTGVKRITQRAHGIRATVVNGRIFMRNGGHAGALAGRLLRGSGAA